jgi:hypothetical protein
MKLKSVITGAIAILAAVGLMLVYSSSFAGKARVATLSNVKGSVTIKKAGTTDWIPAADRMELREGDELKTEAGASAIVRMDDGTMSKIGPLAKMSMGQLTSIGNNNATLLNVSIGKSWNRVQKLTKDTAFSVKTPTAVAGVRGTFFSAEVEKTTDSTFDVYDGSVQVAGTADPNATVLVDAHNTTTVAPNAKPTTPSRMPAAEEQKGRGGFTAQEYAAAKFDIQITVNPQVVEAGKNAVVSLQVFNNGQPYRKALKVNITLSGAAKFLSTGTNEIAATTDENGALTLDITSPEKETVTVSAQIIIKIEKKK